MKLTKLPLLRAADLALDDFHCSTTWAKDDTSDVKLAIITRIRGVMFVSFSLQSLTDHCLLSAKGDSHIAKPFCIASRW